MYYTIIVHVCIGPPAAVSQLQLCLHKMHVTVCMGLLQLQLCLQKKMAIEYVREYAAAAVSAAGGPRPSLSYLQHLGRQVEAVALVAVLQAAGLGHEACASIATHTSYISSVNTRRAAANSADEHASWLPTPASRL